MGCDYMEGVQLTLDYSEVFGFCKRDNEWVSWLVVRIFASQERLWKKVNMKPSVRTPLPYKKNGHNFSWPYVWQ